jgi:hypothetical protein
VVFGKADTDKVLLAHVSQGIGGFVLQHLLEWADRLDPPPPCDPE